MGGVTDGFSPVEEYLAKWLCGDTDPETPMYVVLTIPKIGEPEQTFRTKDKPRTRAEMEVLPPDPFGGRWTYDRGDAPLPMWQAFIVQAREDTRMMT